MAKVAKKEPGKGRHWTPKEEQELALMYVSGVDVSQIASVLSRPEKSIKSKLYRLKLKRPRPTAPVKKVEVKEVVAEAPKPQNLWEWFWSLWKW